VASSTEFGSYKPLIGHWSICVVQMSAFLSQRAEPDPTLPDDDFNGRVSVAIWQLPFLRNKG